MSNHSKAPACLLSFLFCGALAAQLPPGISQPYSIGGLHWPLGSGPFARVAVLAWQPPGYAKDAIVLRGTLGLVVGIGLYNDIQPLGVAGAPTDFVVLTGANPSDSTLDAILITDPTSVKLAWWDPATETTLTQAIGTASWQGTTKLTAVADATGIEVAGVAPDGHTVRRGRFENGSFTAVSAGSLNRTVLDLTLSDDNGDGVLESFFLSSIGVHVLSRSGSHVRTVVGHHPGGALAKIGDRVAWLRRNVSNSRFELVLVTGAPGITNWPTITLNNEDFALVGMRDSNVDKTGYPDLLISQSSTQQALSVRLTATPTTLNADVTVIGLSAVPGASGAGNNCTAVADDIDGDGYDDVVAPLDGSVQLAIVRGVAVLSQTAEPMDELLSIRTVFDYGTTLGSPFANGAPEGLYLRFHSNASPVVDYTRIKVQLWWQEDASSDVTGGPALLSNEFTIQQNVPTGTVAHSLYLPLDPEWADEYSPEGFFHLEVVFGSGSGPAAYDDGLVVTLAGFASDAPPNVGVSSAYLEAGDNHLTSLSLDGGPPVDVVFESTDDEGTPPIPGRTRIGGLCRTYAISPWSTAPRPKDPGPSTSTAASSHL